MIVERRKGERSVGLVYCLTESDRSVAETSRSQASRLPDPRCWSRLRTGLRKLK
jgi:hypothetical protein